MVDEDFECRRISGGRLPPRGMPEERYQRYLPIFRELGLEGGTTRNLSPAANGFYFLAGSDVPLGGKGHAVGYFYSPTPPPVIVRSLPLEPLAEIHSKEGSLTVFRPLEKNWYLFYNAAW